MTEATIKFNSDGTGDTGVLVHSKVTLIVPSEKIVTPASRIGVRRFSYHLYREPYDKGNNQVQQRRD